MAPIGKLTFLEFDRSDFEPAWAWCKKLGYRDSHAYATSSAIPGLYCLPLNAHQKTTVICKTAEHGLVAIQTLED
jgi:hypothetical protein